MDIVEGLRKVIQDLLVPELKAVQVEIRHLNERLARLEERFEAMHEEMDERFLKVDERFEKVMIMLAEIKETQTRILSRLDLEQRIARLEAHYEDIKIRFESRLLVKEPGTRYKKKLKKK